MEDSQLKIRPMTHEEIKREINYLAITCRNFPLDKKRQRVYSAIAHAFCMCLGYKSLSHYEMHNAIDVNETLSWIMAELAQKHSDNVD